MRKGFRRALGIAIAAGALAAVIAPVGASGSTFPPSIPAHLDFGQVKVGETSAPQVLRIVSPPCVQDTPGECRSVPAIMPPPIELHGDFSLVGNTCGGDQVDVHAPQGGECALSIVFAPTSPGRERGALIAPRTSATGGRLEVPLTGIGVPPQSKRGCKSLKKAKRKKCKAKRKGQGRR